jgi:hypothetical protein
MKTCIPTMALAASLTFASANSFAQKSAAVPAAPKTPIAPAAVATPAQDEIEVVAATEAALANQEAALNAQNEALAKVDEKLQRITARAGHARTSSHSLVIPKDAADVKSVSDTEEDMNVMARILEKAASGKDQKSDRPATYTIWGASTAPGTPKNLYIDGYGAIFFVNVNYPLLPPATKEQAPESKSENDSEWEKTKNELYRPQTSSSDLNFNFSTFDSGSYVYSTGAPAEEYDEDKVAELKENLTAALKNASHLRRLKGDDTVTVIVTGRNPATGGKVITKHSQNGSSSSSSSSSWSTSSRSASPAPAARLIIRARRADVESFQKEKLSADDFRKKVTMFTY